MMSSIMENIPSQPGTYTLILSAARAHRVQVGRLGPLRIEKGYYAYVGSAFGPGGLKARIGHHWRQADSPHWHIDYVRPLVEMAAVWYTTDTIPREHCWAEIYHEMQGIVRPLPGFGASDCTCPAHLFFSVRAPKVDQLRKRLNVAHPGHAPVFNILPDFDAKIDEKRFNC